ncbi:unnamed protein product [Paramecium pentaurelia]|uniref:Cyclic nucleotide-binding domain-containing protein n=1 Tax=Paramecium pentaurelia TaxID=43138 RepID=A0A8S1XVV2_9CILI|nr:unnamed protein product [Paramecium pentaurelia]
MDRHGIDTIYKTDSSRLMTMRNNTETLSNLLLLILVINNVGFDGRPGLGLQLNEQQIPESCVDEDNELYASENSSFSNQSRHPSRRESRVESISKVMKETQKIQSDDIHQPIGGWDNKIWQKGALRIMTYVIRFVMALLINSEKFKFTFMKKRQFYAINDQSAIFDYYEERFLIRGKKKLSYSQMLKLRIQNNCLYQSCHIFLQYFVYKIIFIIVPTSTPKLIWDVFLLIILSIQMVFVPLKICFQIDVSQELLQFFLFTLPLYVYLIEILLNFLTGFYEHGVLVIDQKQIALHYLKSTFCYDFLSVMPQFISAISDESQIFEILLLIRLKRLILLADTLEETLNLRQHYQTFIDVVRLLIQFLFLSHLFGCVWHYIGVLEEEFGYDQNWIKQINIDGESWFVRYVFSIYWSSITTLTIGYGDVIPVSSVERMFVVIVAVVSSVVFAYTISSIGNIFSQLNENKKNERHKMFLIKKFIEERNVNKVLANKVKMFFEYFIQIDHTSDNECVKLIEKLDPTLKTELKIDIYRKFISNSKLISTTFSDLMLNEICQLVKEKQYMPDEFIVISDQEINELYFVLEGEVSLIIELNKQKNKVSQLSLIKKNEVLGEKYFLTNAKLPFSAKAQSFVRVAVLDKQQFHLLLQKYPEEFEKYKQALNKVQLQERIKLSGCELCYQNHKVLECPFVFYQPNIRFVVKRQYAQEQVRQSYERRQAKSHNSKSDRLGIQYRLVTYALENNLIQEESINDSIIKKMDLQCLEHQKNLFRSCTDSSINTLIKNNLNPNFQSGGKESQHESQDQIMRQNSNNTHNPRPSFTGIGSTKQMSTLKFIKMNNKKLDKQESFQKIELKVPDKIVLQDICEHSSDSDLQSPDKTKLTKQNSFTFCASADFKTQLKIEYYQKLIINELDGLDKYQEYQFYYPQYNVDKVIETINEKYKLKRLKQSKSLIKRQSRYLTQYPTISIRRKRSGIVGEEIIHEN